MYNPDIIFYKHKNMKKIFAVIVAAAFIFGCSGQVGSDIVKGEIVKYGIKYDTSKWVLTNAPEGDPAEYYFEHKDGDVYAMVVPERVEVPIDTLKNAALGNAQAADPNAKVTSEEKKTVNGKEMLSIKMSATIEGYNFSYHGYYYTGSIGSIQFLAYTVDQLMPQYEKDIEELLNGLEIY